MTIALTVKHNFVCPVADDVDPNTVSPSHWNDDHGLTGVDGINAELLAKADKATTLTAGSGLTGGGDLSANRTFAIDPSWVSQTGNCGLLSYVSATQIKFSPYNGDRIKINGSWFSIPAAGITANNTGVYVNGTAGQNLGTATFYYVYLFNNSGTLTIDFSTTAHATSTAAGNIGIESQSGNDTRSLIGMVHTDASQFVNSLTKRFVRSWFNRQAEARDIRLVNPSTLVTGSASLVELGPQCFFIAWQNELIHAHYIGGAFSSAGNLSMRNAISFDGAFGMTNQYGETSSNWQNCSISESRVLAGSENIKHWIALAAQVVTSGTVSFGVNSMIYGGIGL